MDDLYTYWVKFIVLLVLQIPSSIISIIIFIHFATDRAARIKVHNHSIILLLIINFLYVVANLPMPMHFFRLEGKVQPESVAYCLWWKWYEFSLNIVGVCLMAWISFERHLLIFHSDFINNLSVLTRRILHFGPLAISILWGPIFDIFAIVISPMCTNMHSYESLFCGLPCFLGTEWGTFEMFVGIISPVVMIFIFNLALFVRVIHQRMTVRGRTQYNWRRQRKMAFQLGLISFVYLTVWIPLIFAQFGQIYFYPTFLVSISGTFSFLIYVVPLVLPMVCLMSMPEVIKKIKSIKLKRHRSIEPWENQISWQKNASGDSKVRCIKRF